MTPSIHVNQFISSVVSVCVCGASDHPIHPPEDTSDPFQIDFPADRQNQLQMVDGVMYVYESAKELKAGQPIEMPRPDLATFLAEQNALFAFLADGPL